MVLAHVLVDAGGQLTQLGAKWNHSSKRITLVTYNHTTMHKTLTTQRQCLHSSAREALAILHLCSSALPLVVE